jgi:D-alanyl-lipoteichoic acid acyltransferase DltB (MBOAT superfamily)
MPFNSFAFLLGFLPAVWLGYFGLARGLGSAPARWFLVAASLIFYAWGAPWQLFVLIPSAAINYALVRMLADEARDGRPGPSRKALLVSGLTFNVGLLAYFKYTNFFLQTFARASGAELPLLQIALPVGISFFTIQQVAYLVDAYQGILKVPNAREYAVAVAFFPKLLNGPILRAKESFPALGTAEIGPSYDKVCCGLYLLSLGLAKKMLIADALANVVNDGFDRPRPIALIESWVASVAFTFQLYFDFGGYADMAIGLGLLFGIELPANFDSPYHSRSVIEFWKRWHITLSRFITTYIYTPIVKAFPRPSFAWALWATLLSMLIAGLWHGAALTYVVFGALHGLGLIVNHLWKKTRRKVPGFLAWLATFVYINAAFVFFRATDVQAALRMLRAMVGLEGIMLPAPLEPWLGFFGRLGLRFGVGALGVETLYKAFFTLLVGALILAQKTNSELLRRSFRPSLRSAALAGALLAYSVLHFTSVREFLYFNF